MANTLFDLKLSDTNSRTSYFAKYLYPLCLLTFIGFTYKVQQMAIMDAGVSFAVNIVDENEITVGSNRLKKNTNKLASIKQTEDLVYGRLLLKKTGAHR